MPKNNTARKESFRLFLSNLACLDSPIGDLASDAISDKGWKGNTPESLRQRMLDRCACADAHAALSDAEHAYNLLIGNNNEDDR